MRLIKATFFAVFFCLVFSPVFAVNDGFGPSKKIEGKHFVIYYAPQIDSYSLSERIDLSPADFLFSEERDSNAEPLAQVLDTLYGMVMKALDMNLYSFKGNIKICRDRKHLDEVYEFIFSRRLKSSSFYISEYNTIYISADDFSKEVMGHEIAHMIISNYFVVQPPQKVAEILSGYVEYELRKK